MTSTDVVLGADLAVRTAGVVVSSPALGAVTAAGAALGSNPPDPRPGRDGRTGRWLGGVVRLGFLLWLHDVTDGAAFPPFGLVQDALGGTVWPTVLLVLGLGEVAARVAGLAVRAVTARARSRSPRVDLRKA